MPTRFGQWLNRLLAEPATRGMDLDDPATTARRRDLAKAKRSLYLSNLHWYRQLQRINTTPPTPPPDDGLRIELGSGGGFLDEHIPGLLTTDVMPLPFVQQVCNAESLPFDDQSVSAIFFINVLHHVHNPCAFFAEATRVLKPGGVVAMIEPAVTPLSKIVYRHLHPEPFETAAESWELPPSGPLSGGNDALPWIILCRDRDRFEQQFPHLTIESITHHTVLSRLLSGGVLMRSLLPGFAFPALLKLEDWTPAWMMKRFALFMTVVLRRIRA